MFGWLKVIAAFIPVIASFAAVAQGSERPGAEKHAEVMRSLEKTFEATRATGTFKELKGVEWASVAATLDTMVSITVGLAKALGALR